MTDRPNTFFDARGMTLEQLEAAGTAAAVAQATCNWVIGDIARYAEARWPDTWMQCFPEWMSDGLIARCKAVAAAYPTAESRNPLATYSIHMRLANDVDRIRKVAEHVSSGHTSDQAREADKKERDSSWLLCIDVNYFLHKWYYSGCEVETAAGVAGWIQRTVERLKAKGLTDVACCFDSKVNHRKQLTADWGDKYKDRPPKEPELVQQLHTVSDLLMGHGFACVAVEGYEADDCMASFAAQFEGRVTLLSQDKDLRQCLGPNCNILLDVEWEENSLTGDMEPNYKWLSAREHTEQTGITPAQWPDYQALMGDNVDGIRGAEGIGEKGARDLIQQYRSAVGAIQWAKAEAPSITPRKRQALIEFEPKLEITRQLVTLKTDLPLPNTTRIV